jgi:hypothetical protein
MSNPIRHDCSVGSESPSRMEDYKDFDASVKQYLAIFKLR